MSAAIPDPSGILELSNGEARAQIACEGAEAVRWCVGGRELLWRPAGAFWDRVAPVLFPVVGWCRDARICVQGQYYPMGVHGFAAGRVFEVESQSDSSVRFVLRSDEQTLAQYPFRFTLRVDHALTPQALETSLHITNEGDAPMPYACGLHPGFAWPFAGGAREDYRAEFSAAESAQVPLIAAGGLFSRETRAAPLQGRGLALNDGVFEQEALCFLNARSRHMDFCAPDGSAIRVASDDFAHLALWSKPGAPFVCIETWTGHGDPVGFAGELADKPSMIVLAPGESRSHRATYEWRGQGVAAG